MKTANRKDPIGIFDSGLGGLSVVNEIQHQLPFEQLVYFGDSYYNPYGTKSKEEVIQRCFSICDEFEQKGVKAVVIACNTATSVAAPLLRQRYSFDIIGMEPALKPAALLGHHQTIAVWATDLTLKEAKFQSLMSQFNQEHRILSVACPKLVRLVEDGRLQDQKAVDEALYEYLAASDWENIDSIVLGCTHFVFFKERLRQLTNNKIQLIDGNEGTARHLKQVLFNQNLLSNEAGSLTIENSDSTLLRLSNQLIVTLKEMRHDET